MHGKQNGIRQKGIGEAVGKAFEVSKGGLDIEQMKNFSKEHKEYFKKNIFPKMKELERTYWDSVRGLERKASKRVGAEIELFHYDGEFIGAGDYGRKYKLYQVDR